MEYPAHASPSERRPPLSLLREHQRELSEREQTILRAIVHTYILMASPVGSRFLSKYLEREARLSPATIRNVMSDLEEMGYIMHPHTSAGRVPTDRGYRYYVDSLMNVESLSEGEQHSIHTNIMSAPRETVLRDASKILSSVSHYLAIVRMPEISHALVERIELIALSSTRLLVVLTLTSDIVRAISLEANFEVSHSQLDEVARQLNERMSGKSLNLVRCNLPAVLGEVEHSALVRLFIDSAEKLFTEHISPGDRVHIAGTQHLLNHPEFESTERFKGIIELIESEEVIVHLLENSVPTEGKVNVFIGREMSSTLMEEYSLLTTRYRFTSAIGTIGIIGPKRMNYSKMVSIVHHVANALSRIE